MPNRRSALWAALPSVLIIGLFALFFSNRTFFDWAFARHQNPLSWYIRPLFLIPLCYFSYQRNLAGIGITILALLTSMFWFPEPETVNEQVKEFLAFEKNWLTGQWDTVKIFFTLLVPLSLSLLCAAFWKRNIRFGIALIVLMTLSKVLWSIMYGGEAGKSVIIPATLGLLACMAAVRVYMKKSRRG